MSKIKPIPLACLPILIIGLSASLSPAIANEVRLPLARVDEYAVRSVLVKSRAGNVIPGCIQLLSFNPNSKAFVCRHVSGTNKTFYLRDIQTIQFPLSYKQNQNQHAQQACWQSFVQSPKERVALLIPERMLKISDGVIHLNSSWNISSNRTRLDLLSEKKEPSQALITVLEPRSLDYQVKDKNFLFNGQYIDYRQTTVCGSGGGSGGGGKGFGRTHRRSP